MEPKWKRALKIWISTQAASAYILPVGMHVDAHIYACAALSPRIYCATADKLQSRALILAGVYVTGCCSLLEYGDVM